MLVLAQDLLDAAVLLLEATVLGLALLQHVLVVVRLLLDVGQLALGLLHPLREQLGLVAALLVLDQLFAIFSMKKRDVKKIRVFVFLYNVFLKGEIPTFAPLPIGKLFLCMKKKKVSFVYFWRKIVS